MARQAIAGWRRFLAPYYTASALVVLSYALTRQWWLLHGDPKYSKMSRVGLAEKEQYCLMLLTFVTALKYFRRQSMDSFLSEVLTYYKSGLCLMVYYMDYRVCIYYILLIGAFYLLFPQPLFKGPAQVENFTPAYFHSTVQETTGAAAEVTWLVEFFAPWAPACINLEPVFAELSLKYTTAKLKFGKVDASRWPQLAKQQRVEVYGVSSQLPSFVMYKGGKEVARIPHISPDGTVASGTIRKDDIIAAFALDDFLDGGDKERSSGSKTGGSKSGSGKAGGGGSTKKRR